MRRDFVFLVAGIPKELGVQGTTFFMAVPDDSLVALLLELAQRVPELQNFLRLHKAADLRCVGIRNDVETELDAADRASGAISGLVDTYSLRMEASVPQVCHVMFVRERDSADLAIKSFVGDIGWAQMQGTDPEPVKEWEAAKSQFSSRLPKMFDVAMADAQHDGELVRQLIYSCKMFRHGAESKVFGISFLCKFSALEGFVCGGTVRGKGKLLQNRLGGLFKNAPHNVRDDVQKLWELRCLASHQAKAFHGKSLPDPTFFGHAIGPVEYLFRGTLVFALDHVDQCRSLDELWSHVSGYTLPDCVLKPRPAGIQRFAVDRALLDHKIVLRGIGPLIDSCMAQRDALRKD